MGGHIPGHGACLGAGGSMEDAALCRRSSRRPSPCREAAVVTSRQSTAEGVAATLFWDHFLTMGQEADLLWWVCPTRTRIPAPPPEAAESGSGSPGRAVELIPASSECICSCGAPREWDKINCLYLLSFCFPSSSGRDPALTSQVLSVVTLQTHKPWDDLTLTNRSSSTHTSRH